MLFSNKKTNAIVTSHSQVAEPARNSHSIIADNLHIVGDIRFSGTLRIDGRVDGKIETVSNHTGTLIISTNGQINGPVHVTNMVTNGVVNGKVYVESKLECRNNSKINGQVSYGSLDLDNGAIIEGRCSKHPTNTRKHTSNKSLDIEVSSFLKTR